MRQRVSLVAVSVLLMTLPAAVMVAVAGGAVRKEASQSVAGKKHKAAKNGHCKHTKKTRCRAWRHRRGTKKKHSKKHSRPSGIVRQPSSQPPTMPTPSPPSSCPAPSGVATGPGQTSVTGTVESGGGPSGTPSCQNSPFQGSATVAIVDEHGGTIATVSLTEASPTYDVPVAAGVYSVKGTYTSPSGTDIPCVGGPITVREGQRTPIYCGLVEP